MRWCRFSVGSRESYGFVEDDRVVEVAGSPFTRNRRTGRVHPLGQVKLLVPVIPPTFYAAGVNYRDHIIEMAAAAGRPPQFPEKPDVGYRANNALIAHDEAIVIPEDSSGIEYEGELVAVIGREAKNVSKVEALGYVLGLTLGNDVSERTWQREDRTLWRAKNADTFKPMGPWIVTGLDPSKVHMTVRVNGRVVSEIDTERMIFDVATYISATSRYCTLHRGDVLWTGTDHATGPLKPGDVCEIEATGIGVLRNPVRRAG